MFKVARSPRYSDFYIFKKLFDLVAYLDLDIGFQLFKDSVGILLLPNDYNGKIASSADALLFMQPNFLLWRQISNQNTFFKVCDIFRVFRLKEMTFFWNLTIRSPISKI